MSASSPLPVVTLDHLVVAARTLDEAAAWCERTLGVASQPGGRHAGIGTHNRLVGLAPGGRFPRAYLELIAIDPDAPPPTSPRWFDLDASALADALAAGPRLVHWVARVEGGDLDVVGARLRELGHDTGPVVAAARDTPRGLLSWRITRPPDGSRPAGGAVPLLIAWKGPHPSDDLVASALSVEVVAVGGVAPAVAELLGVDRDGADAAAPLAVTLSTPDGRVVLRSPDRPDVSGYSLR